MTIYQIRQHTPLYPFVFSNRINQTSDISVTMVIVKCNKSGYNELEVNAYKKRRDLYG